MQSAFNRPIVVTTLFVVTIGLIMQIVVSVGLVSELIVQRRVAMIVVCVRPKSTRKIGYNKIIGAAKSAPNIGVVAFAQTCL